MSTTGDQRAESAENQELRRHIDELEVRLAQREQELAALQTTEERFRMSIENMLDPCGIYSAMRNEAGQIVDFRIEYVNAAACRENRMSREAQVGRTLLEILPAHQESGLFAEYCRVVETGEPLVQQGIPYEDVYNGEQLRRYFDVQVVKSGDGFVASWRDVTGRIRTLHRLEQSHERLRLALEAGEMGFWEWDCVEQAVWNRQMCRQFGIECETDYRVVNVQETVERIHPEDLAQNRQTVEVALTDGRDFRSEFRVVLPEGGERWLECVGRLWQDEHRQAQRMLGVTIDITDRKRTHEGMVDALWEREHILERVNDGFFAVDTEWRFTYVNSAAEEKMGKKRSELLGNVLWEVFPDMVDTPFFARYRQAMETQQATQFEAYNEHYQTWLNIQVYPSPYGLSFFLQNVTEQHRLRQEAEQTAALLDSLFQSAPMGLGFLDRYLRFTHINQMLATINGLPVETHLGKRPSELLPDLEGIGEIENLWRQVMESGQPLMDFEVVGNTHAFTERRVWREHFYPVRQQGEVIGLGAMVEDVTVLRQVEADRERLVQDLAHERAQLAALAERLEERVVERTAKVQWLAGQLVVAEQEERQRIAQILHDNVQQMLYGIQMRLYLHAQDLSAESADRVAENLSILNQLTTDAINVTRSLSHGLHGPVAQYSRVQDLLQWLVGHMEALHGLKTTISVQGSPSIQNQNTRILVYNILHELLFNVVKHAGVLVAEISASVEDRFLQVSVRDGGQGFEPEQHLAQGDQQGLGLTNIQRRVELFQGEIQVQSAPGQGTEVVIRLPF